MGNIKALLVSVSQYPALQLPELPYCKNDLFAVREALMHGLNVSLKNIQLCGEKGTVSIKELGFYFEKMQTLIELEDTFIFYFSGHGGNQQLALSDTSISIQSLIESIEKLNAKNKRLTITLCEEKNDLKPYIY